MLPAPTFYGKQRVNPTIGAAGTAIAASTKNPDAAWKLFEYYQLRRAGDRARQERLGRAGAEVAVRR